VRLFCYDLSGKELWKFELPTAAMMGNFGTGVSPIIADGMVVLLRDVTKDAKIMRSTSRPKAQMGERTAVDFLVRHAGRLGDIAGKQVAAPDTHVS